MAYVNMVFDKEIREHIKKRLQEMHSNFKILDCNNDYCMYKESKYTYDDSPEVIIDKMMNEDDISALALIYYIDLCDNNAEHMSEFLMLYLADTELSSGEYKNISEELLEMIWRYKGISRVKEVARDYVIEENLSSVFDMLEVIESDYMWEKYGAKM